MIFKDYNDFELIYLIKERSERAMQIFLSKYQIVLKKILVDKKIYGALFEELYLEGILMLYQCIRIFDNESNFYSYYKLCVNRYIASRYHKKRIKEVVMSLEAFPDVNTFEKPDFIFENRLQYDIADGVKRGLKLNEIAKELRLPPTKIYYEFSKFKKNNIS